MMPLIVLGLLAGLPLVLIMLFRVNGAIAFLALCSGSVIANYVTGDAVSISHSFVPTSSASSGNIVELGLLFLPVLLTIIFLRKGVPTARLILNLLPAAATGALAVLLAVPILPGGVQHNVVATQAWTTVTQYQSFIVGAGALVSLLILWLFRPHHAKSKGKHGK